jgi:hypothetical protein
VSQFLGSSALTEKCADIGAHAVLEREIGLYSNWAAPQDSKAISDFRGLRAYEMTILDIYQIIFANNCLIFMTIRLILA